MYPSEYAYQGAPVNSAESASANCRRYQSGLHPDVFTDQYTHCDGIQLKLTDSDLGQEQYNPNDYYVWNAGRDRQLLFIFPTRRFLTTITLYYYSDSDRGLPRLRFFAVSDDFDIWDLPTFSHPHVDVDGRRPSSREKREDGLQAYTRICSAANKMAALSEAFAPIVVAFWPSKFSVSIHTFFIFLLKKLEGQNFTASGGKCLTKCRHFIGGRTNPGIGLQPVLSFLG